MYINLEYRFKILYIYMPLILMTFELNEIYLSYIQKELVKLGLSVANAQRIISQY